MMFEKDFQFGLLLKELFNQLIMCHSNYTPANLMNIIFELFC